MPQIIGLYVDFQSVSCFRAWRWLQAAGLHREITIRPYSQDSDDAVASDEPASPWDRRTPAWGVELLALGELARESGPDRHVRFVEAAFSSVHESEGDPSSPEAVLALAAAAALDLESFASDSDRWRAEVGLWHREAEDELGVRGVPALLFDNGAVLRIDLDQAVTDPTAAHRLVTDLADLAGQPVSSVVRTA